MSIPIPMRAEMEADPFYHQCAITGEKYGKIDWHHNARWQGKNIQEKFAIIPLAKRVHDRIDYCKEICDWIMVNRMTDDELTRYTKADDYRSVKRKLNDKYGEWTPDWYRFKSIDGML